VICAPSVLDRDAVQRYPLLLNMFQIFLLKPLPVEVIPQPLIDINGRHCNAILLLVHCQLFAELLSGCV